MTDDRESDRPTRARRRVLFVAEAVTLAHVARPVVLARALDPARHDVALACDPRFNRLFGELPFPVRPLRTIPCRQFLDALARGAPLYDADTLRGYVREDLDVLRQFAPDAVVGDFRLSLAVSARLASVPYLTISNAYWSPYARQRWPLPELPLTKAAGVPLARVLFRLVRPFAFAHHARPLNRVRREHGQPSLGWDLRRIYTEADHVLYADVPELAPTFDLPANHHYLGPVLWSPAVEPPEWWDRLPADRPAVYVTLGSSGQSDLLGVALEALAELPVTVLAATAGRVDVGRIPANAYVADYLPGGAAAARASLVVCNGGSPTAQQALAAGRPVLGVASNMDQHLNMEAICRAGAGELLRAGTLTPAGLREAVSRMLGEGRYAASAAKLAATLANYPALERFSAILAEVLSDRGPGRSRPAAEPPSPATATPRAEP
ncbi:MAG TPA: glycosyltransferase [Gemmataceae bacterium]|nr:glycosyltransferase [Gemmataceae bacterium]